MRLALHLGSREAQGVRLHGLREGEEGVNTLRWYLFLAFGLARSYGADDTGGIVLGEPDGVRTSRRNIMALSGLLFVAGIIGMQPGNINVFGIQPGSEFRDVLVISLAAFATQLYWYVQKIEHMGSDARLEGAIDGPRTTAELRIPPEILTLIQKPANCTANWTAALLTVASWGVLAYWLWEAY